MKGRLIPAFDIGRWGGCALVDPDRREVSGYVLVVEWLGFLVEIGLGPVRRSS